MIQLPVLYQNSKRLDYHISDYIGWKIGNRFVTGRWKRRGVKNEILWETQCSCGSPAQYERPSDLLAGGRFKHCRSCRPASGSDNHHWKGTKDIPMEMHGRIRRGCGYRTKDISCDISIQDLQDVWDKSKGLCAYTKWPIEIGKTASVDRIDSNKDYSRDNIQFVHKDINRMKQDYSEEYFLKLCTAVTVGSVFDG